MLPTILNPIRLKNTAGNTGEIAYLREKALGAFLEKLQQLEGENLLQVVLFGSVARGDSRPDSDMDLFVLVREGVDMELAERIVETSMDVDLEEGECKVHIAPFINTVKEYEDGRRSGVPVFYSIKEEGVVLYDVER
jgi:predicted nucleotidyltransferase